MIFSSIFSLFDSQTAKRTDIIRVLSSSLVIVIAALLFTGFGNFVWWLPAFFATLVAINFIAILIAYIFFARTNPDALRSETFHLEKYRMDKKLGDSDEGLSEYGEYSEIKDKSILTSTKRISPSKPRD